MTLKLATQEDIPDIMDMAMKYAAVSSYKDLPMEEDKIITLIENVLRDRNKGIIVLYMVDGKPQGMIAGILTEMMFSRECIATEFIWWVNEGFRTRKSLALKEAYEYWAKRVGAKYIQMAELNDEKVARYYERTGYRLTERAYMKVV